MKPYFTNWASEIKRLLKHLSDFADSRDPAPHLPGVFKLTDLGTRQIGNVLSSFGPIVLDEGRDGTELLWPMSKWHEQFCLVLLSLPRKLSKNVETNTRTQDWDLAVRRMKDVGPSGEMVQRGLRNVSQAKEEQEAPVHVDGQLTTST